MGPTNELTRKMHAADRSAREVSRARTAAGVAAILLVASASAGCAGDERVELRIYDPSAPGSPEVTTEDIVESSIRAVRAPGGSGVLYFEDTRDGGEKFRRLTRAVARKGALGLVSDTVVPENLRAPEVLRIDRL